MLLLHVLPHPKLNRPTSISSLMSGVQMQKDIDFIIAFSQRMADAALCPVAKQMPDNMKEKLDEYLTRKRPKNM